MGALASPDGNLAAATLSTIERLAAASGHKLPAAAASAQGTRSTTDTAAWVVFAIGTAVILFAWAASLRARPPRLFGAGRTSST